MNLKDFQLLKKLMAASTSPADAEALSAVRAANALLAKNGVTWEKVFARTVTVIDELSGREVRPSEGEPFGLDANALFETALDRTHGSFRETIADIYSRYERSGRLTDAQWDIVRRAAT